MSASNASAARATAAARPPIFRSGHLLIAVNFLVCLFLLAPILVVIVTSFSADQFMQFPPSGWSLRWYEAFLSDRRLVRGLILSATLAVFTAIIAGALGSLAAYALSRIKSRFTEIIRALHTAPLVTPGVVTGLAMLIYFNTIGLRGSFFTLLCAHVVLAIPFVILIVSAGLQSFDRLIEDAAVSLGANRFVAFLTVTAPAIKVSMISAALFAFLHSFDEVVVTLFLPGPRTKTLPVAMFDYVQHNLDPLPAAVSTVLIAISLAVILVTVKFGTVGKLFGDIK